jgi:GH15 family glucan-1,4-alpha-glucosidase
MAPAAPGGKAANYHAVWARDMYQIVTALIVEGDVASRVALRSRAILVSIHPG